MCWNQHISLNTFLFSSFVLLLIAYNNNYTHYKIRYFDSIWKYIFFGSFISMQLVEFFIWRNIYNRFYNHIFSIVASIILFIQPIASLLLLPDIPLKTNLSIAYSFIFIPYFTYKFVTNRMISQVSKKGHLEWLFIDTNLFVFSVWLFFFLFSFFYNRTISNIIIALVLLYICIYNYYKDKTIGSMWCWAANLSMIYYACYILLYIPFFESLC